MQATSDSNNAVDLLASNPRIFWGKVIWLLIQRGWKPPPPDEAAIDALFDAFDQVERKIIRQEENEYRLTKRQLQILDLLANGHTNDEIGTILGIAPQTVKFHMTDLLDRMDARNRAHAVSLGFRAGLIA